MKPVKTVTCRPTQHLKDITKKYPHAWKLIDAFRADKGKGLPTWPEWCFCPAAIASIIVSRSKGFQVTATSMNDIGIVAALSAWRAGKGLYSFDKTIYDSLITGEITGNLPSEFLYKLPEWCVYIETPGMSFHNTTVHGFFAHLDINIETNDHELCLLLDMRLQMENVLRSIYNNMRENHAWGSRFNEDLPRDLIDKIIDSDLEPRKIQKELISACGKAALRHSDKKSSDFQHIILPKDFEPRDIGAPEVRMGFI